MRQALMRSFPEKDTATCYRIGKVEEDLSRAVSEGRKLIIGHIDFSHLNKVSIPDEYRLMAMFRHPVERIISTYLHFQQHDDPQFSTWKAGKVDFEEFMKSEYANNWCCQILAGRKGLTPAESLESSLYQQARESFKKLDWIGISSRFEESLFSLSVFMGRSLKRPGRYNEGGQQQEFDRLRSIYRLELLVKNPNDLLIYKQAELALDNQLNNIQLRRLRQKLFNLRAGL